MEKSYEFRKKNSTLEKSYEFRKKNSTLEKSYEFRKIRIFETEKTPIGSGDFWDSIEPERRLT